MINKALRVRIYPNKTQQKKIDTSINCCRFVRNHMIERNSKLYDRRKEHLNYIAMQNLLPNFLLVAFSVFVFVKVINWIHPKEEVKPARICPYCKQEIAADAERCPHCTSMLYEPVVFDK